MAVNNDGTNYFSGSTIDGVTRTTLRSDITSMLTTLTVTHSYDSTANDTNLGWRPNVDVILTGSTQAPDDDLNAIPGDTSTGARFHVYLFGHSSNNPCRMVVMNSATTDTTIWASVGDTSGNPSHTEIETVCDTAKCWAVATGNSLSVFFFESPTEYYFTSMGVLDSTTAAFSYPETIYGWAVFRDGSNDNSGFKAVQLDQTFTVDYESIGSLANYARVPSSGSVEPASVFFARRPNGYGVGTVPNIVTVTRADADSAGIAVGSFPVNLDNITQGNDNIDGSTNDDYICVGYLDSAVKDDDLGDAILMRIYTA